MAVAASAPSVAPDEKYRSGTVDGILTRVPSCPDRVLPAAATLCALIPAVAGFGADTTSVDSVERLREVEVRAFAPRPGVLASVPEYTLSSETMLSSGVT